MPPTQSGSMESPRNTVAVVGGGLVGALASLYFAKRGWKVLVFEKRPDTRLPENQGFARGRSINLAISERGLSSLGRVDPDLESMVLDMSIPMHGRMIHSPTGHLESHPYSVFGEHINSVSRSDLNSLLLSKAEEYPDVDIYFNHSFTSADFDSNTLKFADRANNKEVTFTADLIIGADGHYSKVRQELQRKTMVNFQQEFIEHGYCELTMNPKNGKFAMDPNHLHIWPRKTFMLIALPNLSNSFTCTLFMPWRDFEKIKNDDDLMALFNTHFPDAVDLIGHDNLKKEYFSNPKGNLGYIKCKPYNYKGKVVILGDAAHCMVPFYGQGVNCGFQDVAALDEIMLSASNACNDSTSSMTSNQLQAALDEYSATRPKDAAAIVDMALEHYIEMRSDVSDFSYKLRKNLEGVLQKWMPTRFMPLYSMVTFSQIPYSEVVKRAHRQDQILKNVVSLSLTALSVCLVGIGVRYIYPLASIKLPAFSEVARLFRKP
ncbi:kynurenine 3-monooxygenase, mitochondrial precursor [Mycoemilia scoparia]|uniref:Kynurenine 3-monooxygenase n=1 Tax=Mycoemilia scoparia TaxID=417184 RepID=A0A9W8A602_9FUNG|nr:kynurenine 3-monooxygenase, mitochondrial precursor [Mycoemilia scoparia]